MKGRGFKSRLGQKFFFLIFFFYLHAFPLVRVFASRLSNLDFCSAYSYRNVYIRPVSHSSGGNTRFRLNQKNGRSIILHHTTKTERRRFPKLGNSFKVIDNNIAVQKVKVKELHDRQSLLFSLSES